MGKKKPSQGKEEEKKGYEQHWRNQGCNGNIWKWQVLIHLKKSQTRSPVNQVLTNNLAQPYESWAENRWSILHQHHSAAKMVLKPVNNEIESQDQQSSRLPKPCFSKHQTNNAIVLLLTSSSAGGDSRFSKCPRMAGGEWGTRWRKANGGQDGRDSFSMRPSCQVNAILLTPPGDSDSWNWSNCSSCLQPLPLSATPCVENIKEENSN